MLASGVGEVRLEIPRATVADTGRYLCQASNVVSSATPRATALVVRREYMGVALVFLFFLSFLSVFVFPSFFLSFSLFLFSCLSLFSFLFFFVFYLCLMNQTLQKYLTFLLHDIVHYVHTCTF